MLTDSARAIAVQTKLSAYTYLLRAHFLPMSSVPGQQETASRRQLHEASASTGANSSDHTLFRQLVAEKSAQLVLEKILAPGTCVDRKVFAVNVHA